VDADTTRRPFRFYRRHRSHSTFYRAGRREQDHLASETYSRALTAFGLGMLNDTGLAQVAPPVGPRGRPDDEPAPNPRHPHNAILQQLGFPVNIIAGIGTAAEGNREEIAALLRDSPRGQQLCGWCAPPMRSPASRRWRRMASCSIRLLASRPYRGNEQHIADACLTLGEYLTKDDRAPRVFRRLHRRLRVDSLKLHACWR